MNKETLTAIRKKLPKELFYAPLWKSLFYISRDLLLFLIFSYLIYLTDKIYFCFPIWILQGLSILALFQLSHDLAHGALIKNKTFANFFAQVCILPTLHPVNQWIYGHNGIHHGNTSKLKADLAWHPRSIERYKRMSFIDKFLHKIYWSWYGTGIYYLIKMWLQGLILFPAPNFKAKRDIVFVITFIVSSISGIIFIGGYNGNEFILINGVILFIKLQLIPFIIWNYTIGIIVYLHHINKDMQWKKEGEWTPFYGQLRATSNYKLPAIVNIFAHNIMVHSPHHIHTKIPFYNLSKALDIIRKDYKEYLFERESFWKDYFESTKYCKLVDSNGKWVRIEEIQN
ncbi:MAG: fatty acid desaturase [Leptospiraceae bacterium]|nr:fatty acid desaturase [Leptospiraceae bacterium]